MVANALTLERWRFQFFLSLETGRSLTRRSRKPAAAAHCCRGASYSPQATAPCFGLGHHWQSPQKASARIFDCNHHTMQIVSVPLARPLNYQPIALASLWRTVRTTVSPLICAKGSVLIGFRRFGHTWHAKVYCSSTVRRADAPQTYNISDMITLVVTVSWSSKDDGAV